MSAQTFTIELKHPQALQLLESLEGLDLIHILKDEKSHKPYVQIQESLSVNEFVEDIKKAESEIDNGDFDTLSDFEKSSRSRD